MQTFRPGKHKAAVGMCVHRPGFLFSGSGRGLCPSRWAPTSAEWRKVWILWELPRLGVAAYMGMHFPLESGSPPADGPGHCLLGRLDEKCGARPIWPGAQ